MKLTKLVSLILVFAIMLTLSSCNISDIIDTPDDDQGDLGDEGNDNKNNNNGGNEEGVDLSKYSPLLQSLLTNPEYDRLIERFENKEEGLAESPLFQPHPYAFLEEQGIDTSKIINGELTANTMSYVIENEPNNLYMYTRVNYPDYHQVYLLRYTLTDQEMKEYEDITWHFIGTLQTNKVKKMINKVDYLHSLDSLNLANYIDKYRFKELPCFIQVNLTNSQTKHGIKKEELLNFLDALKKYPNKCTLSMSVPQ